MSEESVSSPTENTSVAQTVATPTEPTQSSSPAEAKWYGKVDSDTEAYITNKGWKQPTDLLKSYQNLERLRGVSADKLVKLPDFSNEEEAGQFFERLGVPKSPEEYQTPELDFELDPAVLSGISHKAKLTPAQHETVAKAAAEYFKSQFEQQAVAKAERDAADKVALEQEWGARKDENYRAATKAAMRFGLDAATLDKLQDGLGYRGAMEFLTRLGRSFGEAQPPGKDRAVADSTPYGLTPGAAREQLSRLQQDKEFRNKLFNNDSDALERWNNLKKIAFSGA